MADVRLSLVLSSLLLLGACASVPVSRPEAVKVKTGTLTPEYSSFNAKVLSEAGSIDTSFVTSLRPQIETVTRLESAYTYKFGEAREQLRVGDAISTSGMWGSSVRYGGMQFGTRTETRSDIITNSGLAASGLAVLPTVADALFASAGDPGASLAQQNLSVARSWRTGGLTASDALGRSVAIEAPMIASTRLVEEGCSDLSVGAGKVRRDYAIVSNEYGPTFANTTVTCGVPLGFTVEGHGEYIADETAAVGIGVARRIGPFGTASFSYASSRADAGTGWLAGMGFEHRNDWFSVALRSRIQSREFRGAGATVLDDPIMQRDLASVGVNVTKDANLSLAYATQTTWSRERMNVIALRQSLAVGRGALSMSAGHSLEENIGSSIFVSYKLPFGFVRQHRSLVQEFEPIILNPTLIQDYE
jgi:outer membrane usher protein